MNNKGITLIALVITIIVLLILAGVSIAMLTGENGILKQANTTKVAQIEGEVKEKVNLAIQSAKMYAEEKSVETSTGYSAAANLNSDIKTEMVKDLTTADGYTVSATDATGSGDGKITVTYTTDSYTSARNDSTAKITFTITVTENSFSVPTISGAKTI